MEIFKFIGDKKIVRPANLPKNVPGRGYRVYEKNGLKFGVINLLRKSIYGDIIRKSIYNHRKCSRKFKRM
jgi:metallophosphoesterase